MPNKLGKPTDQRLALLKGQVSDLLWYGRIETTYDRAKDVQKLAEKIITLAMNTYENNVDVKKTNAKGKEIEVTVDGPKKLAARRKIMTMVYDLQEPQLRNESNAEYRTRTGTIKHPLVEKIFNDYAPKYAQRAADLGSKGGYTRVLKTGPRKGDNGEGAIIELV